VPFSDLRLALDAAGIEPATTRPPGSQGRSDAATTRPARLVQDAEVQWRDVGGAETCPEPLALQWVLSRTRAIEEPRYAEIVALAQAQGYDVTKLRRTLQPAQ
jgi:hypothetical protein